MPRVGWTALWIYLILNFQPTCALPVSDNHHPRRQNAPVVITQTMVSTLLETLTTTTYTTFVSPAAIDAGDSGSTSAPVASVTVPSSDTVQSTSTASVSVTDPVLAPAPASTATSSAPSAASSTASISVPSLTDLLPLPSLSLDPASSTSSPSPSVFPGDGQDPQKVGRRPSPSPSPPSSPPPNGPAHIIPQVMAYYPEWTGEKFPPERVDFTRFDWIDFAFAVPTEDFSLNWDGSDNAPDLLRRLIASAHKNGKHVKLSVGGWTGSKYFSTAVSTPGNRQTFVSNLLAVYNQYNLDGIDIDWEYPGQNGNDGNVVAPDDTSNFLSFLQLLRKTLPSTAKITAAAMTVPWADSQGEPMRDMSAFDQVLDWILLMNYDTWGSSKMPGPNAPLSNACHNATQGEANALTAVETWTAAGFPASKIALGVPSYGYLSRSSENMLHGRSVREHRHSYRPWGMKERPKTFDNVPLVPLPLSLPLLNNVSAPDVTSAVDGLIPAADTLPLVNDLPSINGPPTPSDDGVDMEGSNTPNGNALLIKNEDGGTIDGQVQFRDLIRQGVLQYIPAIPAFGPNSTSSDPSTSAELTRIAYAGHQITNLYTALGGFQRKWDSCSSTPYLTSAAANQVMSYDDPQSLEMKAVFVREAGLLGVNMFDIHGDTDQWDLADAIRRGLGL